MQCQTNQQLFPAWEHSQCRPCVLLWRHPWEHRQRRSKGGERVGKGKEKVPGEAPAKRLSAHFRCFIPPRATAGTYLCGRHVLAPRSGLGGPDAIRDCPRVSESRLAEVPRCPAILGSCHAVPCHTARARGGFTELVAVQPRNADSSTHDGADNLN